MDPGALNVAQLRAELKRRGLSQSGLKKALVERLAAAMHPPPPPPQQQPQGAPKEAKEGQQQQGGGDAQRIAPSNALRDAAWAYLRQLLREPAGGVVRRACAEQSSSAQSYRASATTWTTWVTLPRGRSA